MAPSHAEDHLAEAISHTKGAVDHGKQGHADVLVTHAEAALKHANAAERAKDNPHTKQGITHLNAAIDHGKQGHAEVATGHAEEALTHLEGEKRAKRARFFGSSKRMAIRAELSTAMPKTKMVERAPYIGGETHITSPSLIGSKIVDAGNVRMRHPHSRACRRAISQVQGLI